MINVLVVMDLYNFRYKEFHFRFREITFSNLEHNVFQCRVIFKFKCANDLIESSGYTVARPIDCVYNQVNWTTLKNDVFKTVKICATFTVLKSFL